MREVTDFANRVLPPFAKYVASYCFIEEELSYGRSIFRVFPWNFILGDTSPHGHLFKGTFWVILGDNHVTQQKKKHILGDIMSLMKGNLGDI